MSAEAVLQAAAELVAAFAANDREAYFAAFSEDASFVFYNLQQRLLSRAAYQEVWDGWRRDEGFEVISCVSSNGFVSLQGDVAVFIHDVATQLRMQGELYASEERETIVFRRPAPPQLQDRAPGRWLACHEHLSAPPPTLPSP